MRAIISVSVATLALIGFASSAPLDTARITSLDLGSTQAAGAQSRGAIAAATVNGKSILRRATSDKPETPETSMKLFDGLGIDDITGGVGDGVEDITNGATDGGDLDIDTDDLPTDDVTDKVTDDDDGVVNKVTDDDDGVVDKVTDDDDGVVNKVTDDDDGVADKVTDKVAGGDGVVDDVTGGDGPVDKVTDKVN